MYAPTGIAASLALIALGAILTWAVNAEPEGLDITVVGVVLMVIGLVAFLLTLLFWSSWRPAYRRRVYADAPPAVDPRRRAYVEEPPVRRVDVVEEEVPPPPAAPPP